MKCLWNRLTLNRYATPQDDGRIPMLGYVGTLAAAIACWATWAIAMMIVKG